MATLADVRGGVLVLEDGQELPLPAGYVCYSVGVWDDSPWPVGRAGKRRFRIARADQINRWLQSHPDTSMCPYGGSLTEGMPQQQVEAALTLWRHRNSLRALYTKNNKGVRA